MRPSSRGPTRAARGAAPCRVSEVVVELEAVRAVAVHVETQRADDPCQLPGARAGGHLVDEGLGAGAHGAELLEDEPPRALVENAVDGLKKQATETATLLEKARAALDALPKD